MGFFDKMFSGLTKTRKNIEDLEEIFRNYDIDSEDFYDELEEMLSRFCSSHAHVKIVIYDPEQISFPGSESDWTR